MKMMQKCGLLLMLCLLGAICCVAQALVRISNLVDYNFGTVIPSGVTLTIDNPVCIFNNAANRQYKITVNGQHDSGGIFYMTTTPTNRIPYTVLWKDSSASFVNLLPNTLSATFAGANRTSNSCATNPTQPATLRIQINGATLLTNIPLDGTYTDTISLLLTPA